MTTTGLTDDEKRVKVLEFMGWRYRGWVGKMLLMWPPIHGDFCEPPDPCNDLETMNDALRRLPYQSQPIYLRELKRLMMTEAGVSDWDVHLAPASLRADALLAMLPEPEAGR